MGAYLIRFVESGCDGQAGRRGLRQDSVSEIERAIPGALRLAPRAAASWPNATRTQRRCSRRCPASPRSRPVSACAPTRWPTRRWRWRSPSCRQAAASRCGSSGSVRTRSARASRPRRWGRPSGGPAPGSRVDLAAHDLVIGIEVRGDDAYLFRAVVPGADRRPTRGRVAGEPRFLADQMLGRLAVWLRLLGFDTAEARDRPDSWLLRHARDEGRGADPGPRALARRLGAHSLRRGPRSRTDSWAR